ncbi:MAG: hypothetical protein R6V12_03260, partial [Candidatus Hydrogenedentota bacterium]
LSFDGRIMSKKRKIDIHDSEELAQIDEELDFALEQLESANYTVGGVLEEIESANKEVGTEEVPESESEGAANANGGDSVPDSTS